MLQSSIQSQNCYILINNQDKLELKDQIYSNLSIVANSYNDFWNYLLQQAPEYDNIFKLGQIIQEKSKLIEESEESFDFNDPSDFKILEYLAKFWIDIKHDIKRGDMMLDR